MSTSQGQTIKSTLMKAMKVSLKKSFMFIVFCLFRTKQVCIIVMNEILLSLSAVLENIASTGTNAEDMDKYSCASLLNIGNRLECCCQKTNGSVSERAHFIGVQFVTSAAMSVEVSCDEMSLAATLISREKYGG